MTVLRKFTFTDDSYMASNGCSCCEPYFMECYNCDEPELVGLGSAHSLFNIMVNIIEGCDLYDMEELFIKEDGMSSKEYEMFLKKILYQANITFEII